MLHIRPVVVSVAAWTVGAATAVSVGLIALSAIGAGLTDGPIHPLYPSAQSQADNAQTDQVTTPPPPGPTSDASPTPVVTSPAGATPSDRTVSSRGGTLVARCRAAGTYLVGWSPAPGYRAEDVVRGPARVVRVKFVSWEREITITVGCVDNVAQPTIHEERHGDD